MEISTSSVPTTESRRRLQDKVAIVTGGASGIGAATVELFHSQGAKVVIADIQDTLGQAIAENLAAGRGGKDDDVTVTYIHCDVSKEDDVAKLVDATVAKFGKLDIMYCNAGIVDGPQESIVDASRSNLDRLMEVNMVGAFLGAKHAARVMIPQRYGSVLFTASACTAIGGLASHAYSMSKCGILGLTRNLAGELGRDGIRVNCVSPSGLVTGANRGGMTEDQVAQGEAFISSVGNLKGRILRCDDVARAALFLASDEAQYVSGVNLLVDGGFSSVNPTILNAMQFAPGNQ